MKLSAVILAGGKSSRMGCDKALLEYEGKTLIARAVEIVRRVNVAELFISGRPDFDYSALHCPVLHDREKDFGPIAGIERALEASASPLLLVLAVDLPHMTHDFLEKMLASCEGETGVVPELNGRLEPLTAIYPKRCLAISREFIARSRHAARAFAEACVRENALHTFQVATADASCFANWNTPNDLA